MIKFVRVVIEAPVGRITHVTEVGSPFTPANNPRAVPRTQEAIPVAFLGETVVDAGKPHFVEKEFAIECEDNINAKWIKDNIEFADYKNDELPRFKSGVPATEKSRVTIIESTTDAEKDFYDRRAAYQELISERVRPDRIDATALFEKVDQIRKEGRGYGK